MPKTFAICISLILVLTVNQETTGQVASDTSSHIAQIIYLDSMVVIAKRQGFKVNDFINLVQTDTTFYSAFKNLRYLNYEFTNAINATFFQSNKLVSYHSLCQQEFQDGCRWMECKNPEIQGRYYKNNTPIYLTGKLYERLFFTANKVCDQRRTAIAQDLNTSKSWRRDPTTQIKIIMFSPGRKSTLPIIGKKMDIFNESMTKYYNYSILSSNYQGEPCYTFSIELKPVYYQKRKNKTVVKSLNTYFKKKDFQILYRSYHLKYKGTMVDFDIDLQVELANQGNIYYPKDIRFEGYWDVPTKKAEQSKFQLQIVQVSDE